MKRIFLFLIPLFLLGVNIVFRCLWLGEAPFGFEVDQSVILYWAKKALRERFYLVYAPEFTHWEMLPGYFYGWIETLGYPPAWGPTLLGFIDLFLVAFLVFKNFHSLTLALLSSLILASTTWHFYYSRIIGTCSGVSIFVLLLCLWPKSIIVNFISQIFGLLYYTAFRAVTLGFLFFCLFYKRWKNLLATFFVGLVFLLLVWIYHDNILIIFNRGKYLKSIDIYPLILSYLNSIWIWFLPPLDHFFSSLRNISQMEIGSYLSYFLGYSQTPLGWGISIFLGIGLWQTYRQKKKLTETEKLIIFILISSLLTIGFAATYSHYVFIVPALMIFVIKGYSWLSEKYLNGKLYRVISLFLYLSIGHNLYLNYDMLKQLKDHQTPPVSVDFFNNRMRFLSEYIETNIQNYPSERILVLAPFSFFTMQYWADKTGKFTTMTIWDFNDDREFFLSTKFSNEEGYVIFENIESSTITSLPDFLKAELPLYFELEKWFISHLEILESKEIKWQNQTVARSYLVRWPY